MLLVGGSSPSARTMLDLMAISSSELLRNRSWWKAIKSYCCKQYCNFSSLKGVYCMACYRSCWYTPTKPNLLQR
jgi:hypothetical protein